MYIFCLVFLVCLCPSCLSLSPLSVSVPLVCLFPSCLFLSLLSVSVPLVCLCPSCLSFLSACRSLSLSPGLVFRYSMYAIQLVGSPPYALTWLRYSFFIIAYPLGVTGREATSGYQIFLICSLIRYPAYSW